MSDIVLCKCCKGIVDKHLTVCDECASWDYRCPPREQGMRSKPLAQDRAKRFVMMMKRHVKPGKGGPLKVPTYREKRNAKFAKGTRDIKEFMAAKPHVHVYDADGMCPCGDNLYEYKK